MARYKGNADAGLFDFAAWKIATIGWSNTHKGIYFEMLSICFFNGYVTDRDIRQITGKKWDNLPEKIRNKFGIKTEKKRKKYVNEKMTETRSEARQRWRPEGSRVGTRAFLETETETNKKPTVKKDDDQNREFYLKTLYDEMNNSEWWPAFCMSAKVNPKMTEKIFTQFATHSKGEEKEHRDYSDFKNHFKNYLRKPGVRGANKNFYF